MFETKIKKFVLRQLKTGVFLTHGDRFFKVTARLFNKFSFTVVCSPGCLDLSLGKWNKFWFF